METTPSEIETSIQPFNSQSSQNELLLIKFQQIKEAIAQAKTVEDALQQKRIAGSYEQLAKQWRVDKDIQFDATELRIRSERRLGQLILERAKNQKTLTQASRKSTGDIKKVPAKKDGIPTLIELGVSKNLASISRSLAKIDDGQFEVALLKARAEAHQGNRLALSTTRIVKQVRNENKETKELRFSPIIKPSDNWNVGNVQYGGIDENLGYGYIPGELYANCFWYYAKPGDLVVDPMAGSGQAQRVYNARHEWMGQEPYDFELRLFDLTPRGPYKDLITQHNLLDGFPIKHPDYIVMDIPYYGIVKGQYSNKPEDIANMDIEQWLKAMQTIATHCASSQKLGQRCTIITPSYSNVATGLEVPVPWHICQLWIDAGYQLVRKAYTSRQIQKAQGAGMARMNNMAKERRVMLTDISEILTFTRSC